METRKIEPWLRWPAQTVGMLLVLLFAVMLVGESLSGDGPFPLFQLTPAEAWEFAAVFVAIAGVLLAWCWPAYGGGLALACGGIFNVVESLDNGQIGLVWFAVVFMVVGALLLASGWISQQGDAA